ncbi:hypothetical protein MGA3_12085 [Bacillus methanolicus MGA3]|nr:hypothetical protein MGA3_12085 [Bacillus methanolicus MGA3]
MNILDITSRKDYSFIALKGHLMEYGLLTNLSNLVKQGFPSLVSKKLLK